MFRIGAIIAEFARASDDDDFWGRELDRLSIMQDRRLERRDDASEPVEVSWTSDTEVEQTCAGTLRDVSKSGARIRLDRPIRLKTAVKITVRDKEIRARVLSCVRVQSEFRVGVEFDPESQGALKSRSS